MLVYIQSFIAIILGIASTITDFKEKKVYNKCVICGVLCSIAVYFIFWKEIEIDYIKNYILNFIISILISFLFFYFKIWAAGDAKLFIAIVFMIPFEVYEISDLNVFPAINILIMIFSVAFIYVAIETIYLWIKDEEKFKKIKIFNIKKENILEFIIQYFMGYFLVLLINNVTFKYFTEFRIYNTGLAILCNMLILLIVYRLVTKKKQTLILMITFLILNVIYYAINGFSVSHIDLKMLIFVLALMAFRSVSEKYNYEEIKVEDLKPRMILSFGSVIKFYSSRVKGLPKSTTETTDSRLTLDEVESIKRWSKTKKGENTITIVRHLPFAPFIFLGELLFFILRVYL